MISILAQERLLGAALGCALAGFVVFNERRDVYRSVSEFGAQSRVSSDKEMMQLVQDSASSTSSEIAHVWNRTVDKTLGSLVQALSSRGW